jgi:predicted alpha-1,2-mannosidase
MRLRPSTTRIGLIIVTTLGLLVGSTLLSTAEAGPAQPVLVEDPASLVNLMIGTRADRGIGFFGGQTFPGPDVPFGMIQWGPDTSPRGTPGGGGYDYDASELLGFGMTRLSGSGCPAGGDLPILPTVGELSGDLGDTTASFSHDDETAEVGYYSVGTDSGVRTELTTSSRAGIGRFTFPNGAASHLLLKLNGGATQVDDTSVRIVGDREVVGAIDSGHFCGADNTYRIHFDIRFDQPFVDSGTWNGTSSRTAIEPMALVTGADGVHLSFDTTNDQTVTAKVGISYVSDANAARNLDAEIPGWDFDGVRQASYDAWNGLLGRIRIAGGTADQRTQFYTALYHALLHPNVFSDVNGEYMGYDKEVHETARGHREYATYSGWDIYRSQVQLAAMVAPEQTSDMVSSMLHTFDQVGFLPKWGHNDGETYQMIGDPGSIIVADAYAFGARGFDTGHALDAMTYLADHQTTTRPGQDIRHEYGYLPIDGSDWGCCNFRDPVSTQLEYDSADYAIAAFAKSIGDTGTYRELAARAQDWQNVFNAGSGYMQARQTSGDWAPGFKPGTSLGFVEGTSAMYTPMVPHNLAALIAGRGGKAAYRAYLDSLLSDITQPGREQASLWNEPSLVIPWEYDYVGQPWKTQAILREAQQSFWFNTPAGIPGNDDLGAMSSWYVWSALGMYPVTPGTSTLALGSPLFTQAVVHLTGDRRITITAPQAADDAPFVQSLRVDGRSWGTAWLDYNDLADGAHLSYTLGTTPNPRWASSPAAAPPSDRTGERPTFAWTTPTDGIVTQPDQETAASIWLRNISGTGQVVRWEATVDDGIGLDHTSGRITVPAGKSVEQPLTVTAGTDEGVFHAAFTLRSEAGADLGTTSLRVAVAEPGTVWPYYSSIGVTADGEAFTAGFDGFGQAYSQQALAAVGVTPGATVTADGIDYTWPDVAAGEPNNLVTAGQTIHLAAPAGATRLGLLGAATASPGVTVPVTVTYADGSSSTADVNFADWTEPPMDGSTIAVQTAYLNTSDGGRWEIAGHVFAVSVPTDPDKTISSVTLPAASEGDLHVFAFGYAA